MTPRLSMDALGTLASAAAELNRLTDACNDRIHQFQCALKALNLGIELDIDCVGTEGSKFRLGYARHRSGEWLLYVARNENMWPLLDAPRTLRFEAEGHFEALIQALTRRAESLTLEIKAATEQLKELMGEGEGKS